MNRSIPYFDYDDRDISNESDTVFYSPSIAIHFTEIIFAPFETEDREPGNSEVHAANNVFA